MSEAKETCRIFCHCYPVVAIGILIGTAAISTFLIG